MGRRGRALTHSCVVDPAEGPVGADNWKRFQYGSLDIQSHLREVQVVQLSHWLRSVADPTAEPARTGQSAGHKCQGQERHESILMG